MPPIFLYVLIKRASAKKTTANITGRADATTTNTILNANRFAAAGGRMSNARPYGINLINANKK